MTTSLSTSAETLHGALLQLGDEITQVKIGDTLRPNNGNAWDYGDASIEPVPADARLIVITRYMARRRAAEEVRSVRLEVPEEYILEVHADEDPQLYQEDGLCVEALTLGRRLLRTPRLIAAQAFRGASSGILTAAPIYPEGGVVRPDGRIHKRSGYFSGTAA